MKKIIILFSILMITGCSVNYTATIDNDSIAEDISINVPMNETTEDILYDQINGFNSIYTTNTYTKDYSYITNLKAKFDYSTYANSTFLNKCYESVNIQNTDSSITIKTSDAFRCIKMEDNFEAESVTINIKTKLHVTDNNADKVNGNTYTWIIDSNNYQSKPISMHISKSLVDVSDSVKKKTSNSLELITVMFIFLIPVIILGIVIWFKAKGKNNI